MKSEKKSFLVYFDNCSWLTNLDYEQQGRLFEALYQYADLIRQELIKPMEFLALGTTDMDGITMMTFGFMADSIYRDTIKWSTAVERRWRRKARAEAANDS